MLRDAESANPLNVPYLRMAPTALLSIKYFHTAKMFVARQHPPRPFLPPKEIAEL